MDKKKILNDDLNNPDLSHNLDKYRNQIFYFIQNSYLDEAEVLLNDMLKIDFENPITIGTLKCVAFWKDRKNNLNHYDYDYDKGEYLLNQWKIFKNFLSNISYHNEACLYSIKQHVFDNCLEYFKNVYEENNLNNDYHLMIKIARCYKGKGDYERAIKEFKLAFALVQDNVDILIELGDCYAIINEEHSSKLFFKEAFFINPQLVNIDFLESEMFFRLFAMVKQSLGTKTQLEIIKEWIPVYGVVLGILNIKRELRAIEYGKLRQIIYQLEREYTDNLESKALIIPRLINKYFWLIDYYISNKEDNSKIEDVLYKIQTLDSNIYQLYTK